MKQMKHEIKDVRDGSVRFVAEIDCDEDSPFGVKVGLALIWGYENKANLTYCDFSNAICENFKFTDVRFTGVSFSGVSFSGVTFGNVSFTDVSFTDVSFTGVSFSGVSFTDVRFSGVRFSDVRFSGVSFSGVSFSGVSFTGVSFTGVSFTGVSFSGVSFTDVSFSGVVTFDKLSLLVFKNDLWRVLLNFKDEIPELIKVLEQGKIDGAVYSAKCACLIGTIANIKHCLIDDEQFVGIKNSDNPIERWFMMIKPGHTPQNNFAAKMVLEWINEFVTLKDKK